MFRIDCTIPLLVAIFVLPPSASSLSMMLRLSRRPPSVFSLLPSVRLDLLPSAPILLFSFPSPSVLFRCSSLVVLRCILFVSRLPSACFAVWSDCFIRLSLRLLPTICFCRLLLLVPFIAQDGFMPSARPAVLCRWLPSFWLVASLLFLHILFGLDFWHVGSQGLYLWYFYFRLTWIFCFSRLFFFMSCIFFPLMHHSWALALPVLFSFCLSCYFNLFFHFSFAWSIPLTLLFVCPGVSLPTGLFNLIPIFPHLLRLLSFLRLVDILVLFFFILG